MMRNFIKKLFGNSKLLVAIIFIILSLFCFRKVVLSPGTVGHLLDWPFPSEVKELQTYFKEAFFTWRSHALGYNEPFMVISLWQGFWGFFGLLGFSGEWVSKLCLLSLIPLAGFLMYLLLDELFPNSNKKRGVNLPAFLGSLFYAVSPLMINQILGGAVLYLLAYGLSPLAFLLFIKGVNNGKIKWSYVIILAFLWAIAGIDNHFLIFWPSLFSLYSIFNKKEKRVAYFKFLTFTSLLVLMLHSFWLVNFFFNYQNNSASFATTGANEFYLHNLAAHSGPFASVINLTANFNPALFKSIVSPQLTKVWFLASFSLLIIIFSSSLFCLRRKIAFYAFLVTLIGIFFAKGICQPMGNINLWLYRNFVPMNLFRTFHHIQFLAVFGYSILVGNLFEYVELKFKRQLSVWFILFFLVLLTIYIHPLLTGNINNGVFTFQEPKNLTKIKETMDNLDKKPNYGGDYRIMFFPTSGSVGFKGQRNDLASGGSFPTVLNSPRPTLNAITGDYQGRFTQYLEENIYFGNSDKNIAKLLALAEVRYLIPRNDLVYLHLPYGISFWSHKEAYPELLGILDKQKGLTKINSFSDMSLWENEDFLPHFYIPQNTIYSPNDIEILPDIVGFDDYEIRSAIFLNADNADEENADNTDIDADKADRKDADNTDIGADKADEEGADKADKKNTDNALNADNADRKNADNADEENADKANEEDADKADGGQITRIEGADEIFVKGENKKDIEKILNQVQDDGEGEVFYPYVKHEPGSLKWKAALLKEKYDKWQARKEPEKLLEKHLFYASKRINELKEFYTDNADIKNADNADKKNADNTDEKRITLIEMWEKDLEEAIGLLEKIQEEEKRTEWAIKIKKTIADNAEKIADNADRKNTDNADEKSADKADRKNTDNTDIDADKADGKTLAEQVDRLNQSLDRYIPKLDIDKREYEIEIPRAGNYSLLIKGMGNEEKLGNSSRQGGTEIEKLEIDGEKIADNALNADNADIGADNAGKGADKADRKTQITQTGWVEWGKINLEEGKHILTLKFGEIQNLLKYAPVGRNMVAFGDRNSVATQPEIKKLEIDEWQEDQWYQVKGKYEIKDGEARLIIEERKEKEEEKLGNSLASLAEIEKLEDKEKEEEKLGNSSRQGGTEIEKLEKFEISKEIILTAEDEEFEFFIKADPKALAAQISLVPSGETKIILENLRVEPVWEPEIVLRSKTADNAEKNTDNADIKNADNADRKDTDNTDIGADKADEKTRIPKITFVKINPTKYRIKVEGAKEPYTLVFSESFHEGWRLYADNADRSADKADRKDTDKADEENADEKYGEEVASYFEGQIKEGTHRNTFLEPATFETWGKEPIAEDNHLLVNGYANSWYIDPSQVCEGADNAEEDTDNADIKNADNADRKNTDKADEKSADKGVCTDNADGSYDMELIVEFWPQRLFYIGLFISGLTLVGCLGYLTISRITPKKTLITRIEKTRIRRIKNEEKQN